MTNYKEKYGPWALITGASAGIGKEFAYQFAAEGINIILAARRIDRLVEIGKDLESKFGVETHSIKVDLNEPNFLDHVINEVGDREIGLLIPNAGFGMFGEFVDNGLDRENNLMTVNAVAPVPLASWYGKKMKERGRGGIIFVSSVMAFFAAPYRTSYAASKVFNLYYGTGIHFELKPYGVDVLTLCPGFTKTEFHSVADVNRLTKGMEVDFVVREAVKNLGKKIRVIPGFKFKVLVFLFKILPDTFASKLVGKVFYSRMKK